jgi:hypothetical protein
VNATAQSVGLKIKSYRFEYFIIFMACALHNNWFTVIGQFYFSEVVLAFYFLTRINKIFHSYDSSKKFFFFGLVWLFGGLASNVFNEIDLQITIRDFANTAITIVCLLTVLHIFSTVDIKQVFSWALLGLFIGDSLGLFLQHSSYQTNLFKWGYLKSLVELIFFLALRFQKFGFPFVFPILGILAYSCFSFADNRTIGFSLLIVIFLQISHNLYRKNRFILLVIALFIVFVFVFFSPILALINADSTPASKIRRDYASSVLSLASRPELFYEFVALKSLPPLGYGADFSRIPLEVLNSGDTLIQVLAINYDRQTDKNYATLPVHSQVLMALIRNGYCAVFFWWFYLRKWIKSSKFLNSNIYPFTMIILFFFVYQTWALIFSPLLGFARFDFAIAAGFVLNSSRVPDELD